MKAETYSVSKLLADRRAEEERLYQLALEEELRTYEARWDNTSLTDEEIAAVQELYSLYSDKMMLWLAGLWDPETGGFYYSNSARDYEGFLPDLEDTNFALSQLIGSYKLFKDNEDFLDRLAFYGIDDYADRVVGWVNSMKAADGFYYHPQWGNEVDDTGMFRHLNSANGILSRFETYTSSLKIGQNRVYLSSGPVALSDTSNLPWYMQSEEAIVQWLDSFNWSRNQTYHSASVVGVMGPTLSEIGLLDTVIDYFDEMFAIYENGTFETEIDMASLNGTMKVADLYLEAGRTFLYFEEVLNATIEVLTSSESPASACSVANPYRVLGALRKMAEREISAAETALSGATNENRAELQAALDAANARYQNFEAVIEEHAVAIIRKTTERLRIFLKEDGGFSLNPNTCGAYTVGVQWSFKLPEGDVNGTQQSFSVVVGQVFSALLDEPAVEIWSPLVREQVLSVFANAKPVVKQIATETEGGVDFDDLEAGTVSSGEGFSNSAHGCEASIVVFGDNRYLSHSSIPGSVSEMSFSAIKSYSARYFEVSVDFNIHSTSAGGVMSYYIGNAYLLHFAATETGFTIKETNAGSGKADSEVAHVKRALLGTYSFDTWYTLKIKLVYLDNGTVQHLTYIGKQNAALTLIGNSDLFLNDRLVADARPNKMFGSVYFQVWTKMDTVLFVDNFSFRGSSEIPQGLPDLSEKPSGLPEFPDADPYYYEADTTTSSKADIEVRAVNKNDRYTTVSFSFKMTKPSVILQDDRTVMEIVLSRADGIARSPYKLTVEAYEEYFRFGDDNASNTNSKTGEFDQNFAYDTWYTIEIVKTGGDNAPNWTMKYGVGKDAKATVAVTYGGNAGSNNFYDHNGSGWATFHGLRWIALADADFSFSVDNIAMANAQSGLRLDCSSLVASEHTVNPCGVDITDAATTVHSGELRILSSSTDK